ncbi:hypothetical protein BDZ45DRAFT_295868 [Acephala macrosclerotiorum]|nr:hypothetical protein BDZ45DRAFT_295868 [Acephala macrosclerotiorum]
MHDQVLRERLSVCHLIPALRESDHYMNLLILPYERTFISITRIRGLENTLRMSCFVRHSLRHVTRVIHRASSDNTTNEKGGEGSEGQGPAGGPSTNIGNPECSRNRGEVLSSIVQTPFLSRQLWAVGSNKHQIRLTIDNIFDFEVEVGERRQHGLNSGISAKRKTSRKSERKHQFVGSDSKCEFHMSVEKTTASVYTLRTRNTLKERFYFFFFSLEESSNNGKISFANLVRVGMTWKSF